MIDSDLKSIKDAEDFLSYNGFPITVLGNKTLRVSVDGVLPYKVRFIDGFSFRVFCYAASWEDIESRVADLGLLALVVSDRFPGVSLCLDPDRNLMMRRDLLLPTSCSQLIEALRRVEKFANLFGEILMHPLESLEDIEDGVEHRIPVSQRWFSR
ncbi:MAG: hypothetical protein AAF627_22435 [Myxococcota bacterium]